MRRESKKSIRAKNDREMMEEDKQHEVVVPQNADEAATEAVTEQPCAPAAKQRRKKTPRSNGWMTTAARRPRKHTPRMRIPRHTAGRNAGEATHSCSARATGDRCPGRRGHVAGAGRGGCLRAARAAARGADCRGSESASGERPAALNRLIEETAPRTRRLCARGRRGYQAPPSPSTTRLSATSSRTSSSH